MAKSHVTVLVIDPERAHRTLIRKILTAPGVEFKVFESCGEADGLLLARQQKPEAILLEVVSPSGQTWRILETLKSEEATRNIPVIVVSILDEEGKARRLGADGYVLKPFNVRTLRHELKKFLPV